ncbi:DUF2939 domain-containing protein [Thiocystis violacea]|uniref:DUF2939 domain-containing protein n=1 Tax=Thiocystis violacea TaxID=13725 RepID=UPI001906695A|nr:DUF2939 domain-containing protein [Thiocystis violacea]MBK1716408.1 hypothetical protein [Thiocystis violacea]
MTRLFAFLLAFLVIGYAVWPYYGVYRLDSALGADEARAIAPFVDLPAIQANYKERIGGALKEMVPESNREGERVIAWLAESLRPFGEAALEQTITLDWVRHQLREAASRSTEERPAYFMAGIDYAFFESWNRFLVRLGPPESATRVVMRLQGASWRITDILEPD